MLGFMSPSPPFAGRFAPFGRQTHFRAVLGGEDAVEYLFCGYPIRLSIASMWSAMSSMYRWSS